ncbi:hypothetical protein Emed_004911 [Eimeria media]
MTVVSRSSEAPHVDVGEASWAPSRSIPTSEPSNISSSSFLSLDSAAASQELGLPVRNSRLRSRWGISSRLVLAAIASAAAVAALIAMCAAAYLRAAPSQLTRRRLSEGGSPESSKGLAACGETSGNGSGDDPQGDLQEEELGSPPAKKAKVEDEGAGSDAEAGFQAKTFTSSQAESDIASAGAAVTVPEVESPLESRASLDEIIAAEALVALWGEDPPASSEQTAPSLALHGPSQLPSAPREEEQHARGLQQQGAAAPPLAFVSFSPIVAVGSVTVPVVISPMGLVFPIPAGVEGPQPQPAPVQLAAPRSVAPLEASSEERLQEDSSEILVGSRAELLSSNKGLEVIDPLGEWEPPSFSGAGGQAIVEHPFSRLPRVPRGDPSAYSSFFSPQRAISDGGSPMAKSPFLREVSTLLAQDEVPPDQMRHVASLAERLVSHLMFNETRQPQDWPAYAVEVLGFRFLLLDMTVCTLQLLGVPCSGAWWEKMVSRIPDENIRPFTKWKEKLPKFNVNLMTRLTAAIRMLKAGRRPHRNVVVHLKRCLFCSKLSPIRFLRPVWDPWRQDDRDFYKQFEGRLGRSDSAQPGPSHQSAL